MHRIFAKRLIVWILSFSLLGTSLPSITGGRIVHTWDAESAFERLARIAAGLESRILGELEILGQVRAAYKAFHGDHGKQVKQLDRFFQEALALGRKARRHSGIDTQMTSLSGLAARLLIDRVTPGSPIAIIGSGSLAASSARYLSKRGRSPIRVMSRCPEKAAMLALKVGGFGSGLDTLAHQLDGVEGIICATAAPHPILYAHHLDQSAPQRTIIDLGEPPDCHSCVRTNNTFHYLGLLDIEAKANVNTDARKQAAEVAGRIVREGAAAWVQRN